MNSIANPLLWVSFAALVTVMLLIDLIAESRHGAQTLSTKQAVLWSLLWVAVSLLFALAFWWYLGLTVGWEAATPHAMAFLAGYLLEKALAVDNVFVWLILFNYFAIPLNLQRRVLIWGVLGAIILRTFLIIAGSWLITQFSWILYLFGLFLLFTAIKMVRIKEKNENNVGNNPIIRWLKNHLRITDQLEGEQFLVRRQGVLFATPLLLVLIMVEFSDIIFAVDSIPAIFAVTTDPFIVLTSNLFAILGLRAIYFLLAGVADRFTLLKYGLAVILAFIGVKMLIADLYHIPVGASLGVIGSILALTMIINLQMNRRRYRNQKH